MENFISCFCFIICMKKRYLLLVLVLLFIGGCEEVKFSPEDDVGNIGAYRGENIVFDGIPSKPVSNLQDPFGENILDGSKLYVNADPDEVNNLMFVEGEIIVKIKEGGNFETVANRIRRGFMIETKSLISYSGGKGEKLSGYGNSLNQWYKIKFEENINLDSVILEYKDDGNLEYMGKNNKPVLVDATPDDEYFSIQWPLYNFGQDYPVPGGLMDSGIPNSDINILSTWDVEIGDENIVVAVLDTGVDYHHIDVVDNLWINVDEIPDNQIDDDNNGYVDDVVGYDFSFDDNPDGGDNDPMDPHGHGTHVSGTIAAGTSNGVGISGVCQECKIMPLKFFYDAGEFEIAQAFRYAVDNGARVLSNSWTFNGGYDSEIVNDAIDYAYHERDAVIVFAAANSNTNEKCYPAANPLTISVAATDSADTRASFSNYGSWVDVAAPGVDILSLRASGTDMYGDGGLHIFEDDYYIASGTSMAAPHVAGIAALILSKNPQFSSEEVRNILKSAIEYPNSEEYIGTGRVDSHSAISVESIPIVELYTNIDPDVAIEQDILINFYGTAMGSSFVEYSLNIGEGVYPDYWNLILSSDSEINSDFLYTLDTSTLRDGKYAVKLVGTIESAPGVFQDSFDVVPLEIDKVYFTNIRDGRFFGPSDYGISGTIGGEGFASYILEYTREDDPDNWSIDGITLVDNGQTQIIDGELATFDIGSSIEESGYYLLRLSVNFGDNQDHEIVRIYIDLDFKEGWPAHIGDYLGEGMYGYSPVIANVDGGEDLEILVYGNHHVFVFKEDGSLLDGWPQEIGCFSFTSGPTIPPSVGDVDGDGENEIVIPRYSWWGVVDSEGESCENCVYAWNADGSPVEGWPVTCSDYPYDEFVHLNQGSAVLYDLNYDGKMEIIVNYPGEIVDYLGEDGEVIRDLIYNPATLVFESNGEYLDGWPVVYELDEPNFRGFRTTGSPAVGDVDCDGDVELVVLVSRFYSFDDLSHSVYILSETGEVEYQIYDPDSSAGDYLDNSPILVDLDGDCDLEIGYGRGYEVMEFKHHTGERYGGWPVYVGEQQGALPAVGRIYGGDYMVVFGDIRTFFGGGLLLFNEFSDYILTKILDGSIWVQSTLVDLDGDGSSEIFTTSFEGKVHGFGIDGNYLDGFPKNLGELSQSGVAMGDIDSDGLFELVAADWTPQVYVWDLDFGYNPENMDWPMFQHDAQHTGNYNIFDGLCFEDCSIEGCEGQPCGEDMVCNLGACGLDCPEDWFECNGECVDPMTDENHCGGCNIPCPKNQFCFDGECQKPEEELPVMQEAEKPQKSSELSFWQGILNFFNL
jgi:subtilisin family serine protease